MKNHVTNERATSRVDGVDVVNAEAVAALVKSGATYRIESVVDGTAICMVFKTNDRETVGSVYLHGAHVVHANNLSTLAMLGDVDGQAEFRQTTGVDVGTALRVLKDVQE